MTDIPVFIYHSVNDRPGDHPMGAISFTAAEFSAHLRRLRRQGRELISCSDLLDRVRRGRLREPYPAVLTFDDGFLDAALVAADILEENGARATLFVNPGHVSPGPVRTAVDVPNAWGLLNFEEMRRLRSRGVFEVDSHTLTHECVFLSDRLVDLYEPAAFDRYFWLLWMLDRSALTVWDGDVRRYAAAIPPGYPVFEFGRALEGRRFMPSPAFVARCRELYAERGRAALEELRRCPASGEYESGREYEARVEEQVGRAREILARELPGSGRFIAFPGEVASETALAAAADLGYELYMKGQFPRKGRNLDALTGAPLPGPGGLRGLRRICVSFFYRGFLPKRQGAAWAAGLKCAEFEGRPLARALCSGLRFIRGRRERRSCAS